MKDFYTLGYKNGLKNGIILTVLTLILMASVIGFIVLIVA